ncbi:MAG: hypothetical protein IMZ44_21205, partial [Planctomycetes bacterium]|nr:hypothetical protein [Planctomycetota bacterium]
MSRLRLVLTAAVVVSVCCAAARADTPTAGEASLKAVKGRIVTDADGTATAQEAVTLSIGPAPSGPYRFEAQVQLAERSKAAGEWRLAIGDPNDTKAALAAVILNRDDEGYVLSFHLQARDIKNRPVNPGDAVVAFKYWPNDKTAKPNWMQKDNPSWKPPPTAGEKLKKAGFAERFWHGRWFSLLVDVDGDSLTMWFDGRFVATIRAPSASQCPATLLLGKGDKVRNATLTPYPADRMIAIDLQPQVTDRFPAEFKDRRMEAGGVPFRLPQGPDNQLSLRQAQWIEWKTGLTPYWSAYDGGAPMLFDARMPMLRIPSADYVAVHLLAVADDDPNLTSTLTVRAGSYNSTTAGNYTNNGLVDHFDFTAAVPRKADLAAAKGIEVVQTSAGPLAHVRVPIGRSIAQDFGPALDVELTKEVRLLGSHTLPLGLPSGVRIAAITFEKSPLQMKVTSSEPGHAFLQPQKPTFQVQLTNITAQEQPFTLTAVATHLDGTAVQAKAGGKVAAGATENVSMEIAVPKRGYYDLAVTVSDGRNRSLLTRKTSLALLPPDIRKHRNESPFGTWQFGGGHYACTDPDRIGPLYAKAGFRYGMWGFKAEDQMKYGIIQSPEPAVTGWTARFGHGAEGYRKALEQNSTVGLDPHPIALMFHEDGIGGKTDEERANSFQKSWDDAIQSAKSMRKEFPNVKLSLGNGEQSFREEFYRRKFPADLFDYVGLEAGGGYPESQPPGGGSVNLEIWMERQLLDSYWYKDKLVYLCSESCYPSTGPGRLSGRTQADYFIRHSLQALAWGPPGMPDIRFGIISDAGSAYYFTMWGGAGFCNRMPELNVKPSFVAMATLTRVLDGAKFERDLDLGSPSLYGLEFRLPDGSHVVAMWTPQGRRPVKLAFQSQGPFTFVDSQANETPLEAKDGAVEVTLTPSPAYLVTPVPVRSAQPGQPSYDDKPAGTAAVLSGLANMDGWTVDPQPADQPEGKPTANRRLGDLAFEAVEKFEGKDKVVKVTPRPIKTDQDTQPAPMYGRVTSTLTHKEGIPMPGTPTEIGMWVNGNSSWGRVTFVLQDASGQQWRRESSPIDFDGWRYLAIPLPCQYPGPENRHWPRDKDGVAHYPLSFRKLIIELPEKTLHVKTFAPAPRSEIYLKDLTVGQGDT